MGQLYGAYITVRYWCANLFDGSMLEDLTGEEIVQDLIDGEGVLGLADSHEIVGIEIVAMPEEEAPQ